MTSSGVLWPSLVSVLFLVLTFNKIRHAHNEYDSEAVHLHEVLINFAARGQSTVELFAPLSATIGSLPDIHVLLDGAIVLLWAVVGQTLLSKVQLPTYVNGSRVQTALFGILAGSLLWLHGGGGQDVLLSKVSSLNH
jgi:hypothetical protein